MTTQPLTKSDWDGHPVWWVRQHGWMSESMVIAISETEIVVLQSIDKDDTGSFRCLTWGDLCWLGGERSHDRVTWTPCSKPAPLVPQPDTVDVEKLIEVLKKTRNLTFQERYVVLRAALAALHPRLKEEEVEKQ